MLRVKMEMYIWWAWVSIEGEGGNVYTVDMNLNVESEGKDVYI